MDSPSSPEDNNATQGYDQYLDARGLRCPLPLLKAKQALNRLKTGERLAVLASDPGSWEDFARYTELSSHQLATREKQGQDFFFILQKGD
ncbi:sulfurtransferase TusA family protein [Marinospirillum perlucidum]|uniref:sulfurtransferase TusA family protein n=1 Tax=Marinospirillum perlucidum TaxID=1982602 RepID=UPI000DF3C13D|nr:sulfurtransferase TusA family protein [Marinospirillum perlucidum]